MKERYDKLFAQFLAITQREQLLILLSGVVVIGMVGYLLFIEPMNEAVTRDEQNIASVRNQVRSVEAQIEVSEYAFNNDPNEQLVASLDKLKQRSLDLDTNLQQETVNLVPPKQMPLLLEKVLAESKGVTLISMQSIPPRPCLT